MSKVDIFIVNTNKGDNSRFLALVFLAQAQFFALAGDAQEH
jgi:hypothetical protein